MILEESLYKNPITYLHEHSKRFPDFHTRYNNYGHHKWVVYNSQDYKNFYNGRTVTHPHHREVLPDEVVIDVDSPNKEHHELVLQAIRNSGVNYSCWFSGNKGMHIHTYWNKLPTFTSEDRKYLKKQIIYDLLTKELSKLAKVDLQLTGKHMIRNEYGTHERSRWRKDFIEGRNELQPNELTEELLKKFKEHKRRQATWQSGYKREDLKGEVPNCIKFFLGDDFVGAKDGRKMASFALASWFVSQGMSKQEVLSKLEDWNHYHLHDYLKPSSMWGNVNGCNGSMGCRGRMNILEGMFKLEVCKGCKFRTQYEESDKK